MSFGSRRIISISAGTLVLGLLCAVFASAQAGPAEKPQLAEEVFKNVPALKGIPVDEFMDTMGMIAAALSMNCVDCHTSDSLDKWENFAKDTPLKRRARGMIEMVNGINKANFGNPVAVLARRSISWKVLNDSLGPKIRVSALSRMRSSTCHCGFGRYLNCHVWKIWNSPLSSTFELDRSPIISRRQASTAETSSVPG